MRNSTPKTQTPASNTDSRRLGNGGTDSRLEALGLDANLRFKETRKITVEIYDRGNDGGTPAGG